MEGYTNKSQDLWIPYKQLERIIRQTISRPTDTALLVLEDSLRKFKQSFLTLLRNPPKNPSNRKELHRGLTKGITISGIGHQVLSKELVEETVIISDMFDLNEYVALDLLCVAQIYMSHYPGLTRGLVAVLLYYDGRNALVNTLKLLVQARVGILWASSASQDVVKFITRYTDQLMKDGLFIRIFELLRTLDISSEIELLQKNRALGGLKHHRQVIDLFEQIRQNLAEIVFYWAGQSGLPRDSTLTLIQHLKTAKLQDDPSGGIDNVTFILQMGLMYALDLSMLQRNEDDDDRIKQLPLVSDKGLIDVISQELSPEKSKWESDGLQSLTAFTWGLSLATLRLSTFMSHSPGSTEQADVFVDFGIKLKVFDFLHRIYLENKLLHTEEYYVRRMHGLFTDFIVLMHSKVKDLRLRADETARTIQVYSQEGLEPPANLPQYYQNLLLAIAKLYKTDGLNLKLVLDFWNSIDSSAPSRSTSRAISLFKFVRQAGELLPPSLFVPYLKMLSSLASCQQAARHTFNLLKQNGPGNITMVSWDHFFNSLNKYYLSLRQETLPIPDNMYTMRSHAKGITPMELQGLHCVLLVIRTVATHDEFSRIAMCEHPGWAPISVLLGLVSCSVPILLKADLLETLVALSKSPEIANQLWNDIETSQIVLTIPSTSSYQPRGIETELEEIESQREEYPLSKSFLHLMNSLVSTGIPRTLGAGTRKPGFDPYLNFIVCSIFNKFNSRLYKDSKEKWEIAKLCLELFVKFLHQYDPQAFDFPSLGKVNEMNSPPGYHIMIQLNSKSELSRIVFWILHETIRLLDTYANFDGKQELEETSLLCLQLIDQSLQLQTKFFTLLSSTECPLILTKINKLFMSMNQNSNKPDHLVNVTKFLIHSNVLKEHAMYAVKILSAVLTSQVDQHLLVLLTENETIGAEVIQGFVNCIEAEDEELNEEMTDDSPNVRSQTKLMIINLLKQCLTHKTPNLTHFLFGFDIQKDVRSTVFQHPGVLGFPRTCLHAIFDNLNKFVVDKNKESNFNLAVIESLYSMVYILCANPNTSEPVFRFIRSKNNFFNNHIEALPINAKCDAITLNRISWVLKIIAIEIKIGSESNHISQLNTLVKLFLGYSQKSGGETTAIQLLTSTQEIDANKSINRLVALLNNLSHNCNLPETPRWDFFDNASMDKLLQSCEHSLGGVKYINIKKLHRILIEELNTLQGSSAASQKQLIVKEIEKILTHAIKYNKVRNDIAASEQFMESWREIVEILFLSLPTDVLNLHSRQNYIVQILHSLLFLLLPAHVSRALGNIISEVTFILFTCLRKAYIMERKQTLLQNPEAKNRTFTLYSSTVTLQHILKKIIEWIIVSDVNAQKIRVNLYGALLQAINILSIQNNTENENVHTKGISYLTRLDNTKYRITNQLYDIQPQLTLDELSGFGEKLFTVLCHDCSGGHDIAKLLSLSAIDLMMEIDRKNEWINFLSSRGYLKYMIDSLLSSDSNLKDLLNPSPQNLRELYLYVSKMTVLCRIAMSRVGAQTLLQQRVLSSLSRMYVFDYHPEIRQNVSSLESDLLPPVEKRYQQIFLPILNLCDAILTSLGVDNQSATTQILHLLFSHSEPVELILRNGNPGIGSGFLKELALLTGVIARTTNFNTCRVISEINVDSGDTVAFYTRIQKLMLALFPRFVLTDNVLRDVLSGYCEKEFLKEKSSRMLYSLQISCHLVLFTRNIIVGHGIDHRSSKIIFPPTLNEANSDFRHRFGVVEQTPGLGVVIKQLLQSVQHYEKEKVTLDFLSRKLNAISNMNSADLKDFIVKSNDKFNIMDCRLNAHEQISATLKNKQTELKYCTFLIENCLYLIWAHLEYYMARAIPKTGFQRLDAIGPLGEVGFETASEASWKVTLDDVNNLKQSLVGIFNETFSNKLTATTQNQPLSNKNFIEALIRRIKRLIQFKPIN